MDRSLAGALGLLVLLTSCKEREKENVAARVSGAECSSLLANAELQIGRACKLIEDAQAEIDTSDSQEDLASQIGNIESYLDEIERLCRTQMSGSSESCNQEIVPHVRRLLKICTARQDAAYEIDPDGDKKELVDRLENIESYLSDADQACR